MNEIKEENENIMKLWFDDTSSAPDDSWVSVRHNKNAKEILLSEDVEEFSLNHGRNNGMNLVKWMVKHKVVPNKITIHSCLSSDVADMANYLLRYSDVLKIIVKPFDLSDRT